jgi:(p)ppGpp synthase/HD superfamily hydrolase
VTHTPEFFHQLIDANRSTFAKFNIPILNPGTLVNLVSATQSHDPSREEIIYAVTPHNNVIKLPQGATPVDFAYKIHTRVGDRCIRALVNGQVVPLDRPLKTGDVVEIIKDSDANPDPGWLNFVVTRTARQGIHRGLKLVNTRCGWKLVKQVFGKNIRTYRHQLEQVARLLERASVDDLVSLVGAGELSLQRLQELTSSCSQDQNGQSFGSDPGERLLSGTGEQSWRVASCCTPLPGDTIIGVIGSPKRMIRIHRSTCANVRNLSPKKLRPLTWKCDRCRIQLQIILSDQPDIFRPILNKLVENSITPDLRSVNIFDGTAKATLGITIFSRSHLEEVLSQISSLPHVLQVKPAKPILLLPGSVSFNPNE